MEMQLFKANEIQTINSRVVAAELDIRHHHLVRDIDGYIEHISQNPNLVFDDFFLESTYQAGTGKNYKCYELTRKGCEFIANKMTGKKGSQFTALYINKFHDMEQTLQTQKSIPIPTTIAKELDATRLGDEEIIIHKHDKWGRILTVTIDGVAWVKAKDVAIAMGYTHNIHNVFRWRWVELSLEPKVYRLPTKGGAQVVRLINREMFEELVDDFVPHRLERRERVRSVIKWILSDALPHTPKIKSTLDEQLPTPINYEQLEQNVTLAERVKGLITPEMPEGQREVLQTAIVDLVAKKVV